MVRPDSTATMPRIFRPAERLSPSLVNERPSALHGPRERLGGRGVGVLLALSGAIAFSGKAIIVKLGYRYGADAITLIALRMAVALPFFAVIAVFASRRAGVVALTAADRWKVAGLGFLGYYFASYLDFLGLEYVSASLERLILYLNPTLVLLIGIVFFGRKASGRQWTALVLGYGGVVIAFLHDFHLGGNSVVLGCSLVFASAVAYAIYLVGSGELVARVGTLRLTAYASSVASVCCIAHFVVTRPISLLTAAPAQVWELSLINGILCTVVPVFAVMMAIARLGASTASQIGMVGPVSTIVLADLLLDEHMGPLQVAGTVLVMAGVFIVSQGKRTAAPINRTLAT